MIAGNHLFLVGESRSAAAADGGASLSVETFEAPPSVTPQGEGKRERRRVWRRPKNAIETQTDSLKQ